MMPNVAMTITPIAARRLKLCATQPEQRRAPDETGVAHRRDGGDRVRRIVARPRPPDRTPPVTAAESVKPSTRKPSATTNTWSAADRDRAADQRADSRPRRSSFGCPRRSRTSAGEDAARATSTGERDEHDRGDRSRMRRALRAGTGPPKRPSIPRSGTRRRTIDRRDHERRRPEQGGDRQQRSVARGAPVPLNGRSGPQRADGLRPRPRRRARRGSRSPGPGGRRP